PDDIATVGHETEGLPLYAARGRRSGHLIPGKVRHGFAGANVGLSGKEVAVKPFEVLVGEPAWRAASGGQIPDDAVPGGHDKKGNPLCLARARLGPSLHPGKIGPGMAAALIPFGGAEVSASEYEVLVAGPVEAPTQQATSEPLLFWDFENVMSERGISISVGISAAPQLISGFVSQTGGGPAEVFGEAGTVFLTRHL